MAKRNSERSDPAEFWQEQASTEGRDLRRWMLRWILGFGLLFGGVYLALWWSSEALQFGASRVAGSVVPTYEVTGSVLDTRTGEPVRWATVADDPAGQPPHFAAETDQYGRFRLMTLSTAHEVRIAAHGYHPGSVRVGREWFGWWPKGSEQVTIRLIPM